MQISITNKPLIPQKGYTRLHSLPFNKDISLSFDLEYYKKSCCDFLVTLIMKVWKINLLMQRI